jgi:DNA-binding GntR family transcriptional regulator
MSQEDQKMEAIADNLRARIKSGEFGTGGRLPSVIQLAKEHSTTRTTVYKSIALLQAEGHVIAKSNSFYANPVLRISTNPTPTFEQVLADQNLPSSVRNIIEPEIIIMPDETAIIFGQPTGLHVIHRYRVQGRADVPCRLSEYWYPQDLAQPYLQKMRNEPGYDTLASIKTDLGISRQKVHDDVLSRIPTKDEAALLSIPRNVPVQEVRRTNRSLEDRVLMYHRIVLVGPFSILGYDYEL